MNSFFSSSIGRAGAIIALALAGVLGGGAANAAGTAAGTSITNLASLTYSVGSVTQTSIGSSPGGSTGTGSVTSFLVDNKIDLTVAPVQTANTYVVPGQTIATVSFTVTNLGNNTQDYKLTVGSTGLTGSSPFAGGGTDNFDPTSCSVVTVNGSAGTYVNDLAADGVATVVVQCSIPIGQVNLDVALVSLTAKAYASTANGTFTIDLDQTTANTQAGVEVVFADAAGTESGDIARDAQHSARNAFQVQSSVLTVSKSVTTICDPYNANAGTGGPKNIPGAFVQYTISIVNSGSASAILSAITDTLVSQVAFDANLIASSAVAAQCATGATNSESG